MLKKILAGLVLLTAVLAVAAVIAIKVMITPERIRETIIPLVEKQLHRKIAYGNISIGILSGISVSDLKIFEKNGTDVFVSAKSVDMRYRLMPLLSRNIEISKIVLDQPKISAIRFEDGSFNFSDILSQKSQTVPETKSPSGKTIGMEEKPVKEKSGSSSMALVVKDFRVTDGAFLFQDRLINPKAPPSHVLNRFNLKTSNFSLEQSFPLELSALINGSECSLSGKYSIKGGNGDFALKLNALDLLPFAPYFAESIPGKLEAAKLSAELSVAIEKSAISSRGKASIDGASLKLDSLSDSPLENLSLALDYDLSMDLAKQLLDIPSAALTLNGLGISGSGSVDLAQKTPVLNLALSLKPNDLAELMQKAPAGLVRAYQDYALQGKVAGNAALAGPVDQGADLLKSAELNLDQVSASVNHTPAGVNGKLSYAAGKLKIEDLDFHYAGQHGKLSMDMDYLSGKKPLMRGTFSVTADKMDLNKLTAGTKAAASKGTGAPKPQDATATPVAATAAATEIGPLNLPLDIKGNISVGEILYKNLPMTGGQAQLALKNNVLTVEKTARIADGSLSADAKVNLAVKGFSYDGRVHLGEADISRLIAGLFPEIRLHVEGKANADASFSGRGTLSESLMANLRASGKANISEGLVKDTEIQNAIALFLGISELKIVSFESLESDFSMKNKVINQSSLLDSSKLQVKSTGTVSLNGPLDLVFDSRFSPELMAKIKGVQTEITKFLTDEKGWSGFSLTVKGTMDKPKIGLDTESLKKQAGEALKEKLTEKLTESLGIKDDTSKDILQQLFQGADRN